MKKWRIKIIQPGRDTVLILRKMKLTTLLSIVLYLTGMGNTLSQKTVLSLDLKNVSVTEFIQTIENETDFYFIYQNGIFNTNKRLSIYANNESLEAIMQKMAEQASVDYFIAEKQIVLIKKTPVEILSLPLPVTIPPKKEELQPRTRMITGIVTDAQNMPMIGVSIMAKGTTIGTITNLAGSYTIEVPINVEFLVFSYVGMGTQEVAIGDNLQINVVMKESDIGIDEVVVVGYGIQRKESVVGSIVKTTQETLERRGGVSNLGSALSGQLPGVNVLQRRGEPGAEDPTIYIRGRSTWNDAQPLFLVDGVERRINDIDVSEVESVSVLKDASATAVFGVKGANGVILVTTRRGRESTPKLTLSANYGIKGVSRIYRNMDSYEARNWKNAGVEREVAANENAWVYIMPYEQVQYYKKPQEAPYKYLFPNVDWADEMLNKFASNQRINLNINGGTQFVKYFGSISYSHEGDIFKTPYNEQKGYDPGFSYDRVNFRGNLDFKLSKSTDLTVNLSGYTGSKVDASRLFNDNFFYNGIYSLSPEIFPLRHEDGIFGRNPDDQQMNPYAVLNNSGIARSNRTFLGTDVNLRQQLDFLVKGLSVSGKLSFDNYIVSNGPNINDGGNQGQAQYKYISPNILFAKNQLDSIVATQYFENGPNEFDFVFTPITYTSEGVSNGQLSRALFYQVSLNYNQRFSRNEVSGLILMNRRENAVGAVFPSYREDYVGRLTYDYGKKYFLEVNGAYNGSEKFSSEYRYGFFPSAAVGWMLSNERFLSYEWLDMLKVRASMGKVGSDSGIPRWAYQDSWVYQGTTANGGGNTWFGFPIRQRSPYVHYFEDIIANPSLRWETSIKRNIGLDIALFSNTLKMEIDFFKDNRKDIFLRADQRNIPATFGASPVSANIGKTETSGFEMSINYRKSYENGWSIWLNADLTKARDIITEYEDPVLMDDYMKRAGYAIGQTRTQIRSGFMEDWDDVYASSPADVNIYRLPGDWDIVDFNGDGVINTFDVVPFGFPNRPQNTYSSILGFGYKSFSFMMQFYGTRNSHINISLETPSTMPRYGVSQQLSDYWTPDNTDAFYKAPRLSTGSNNGDIWRWDGSYLRLKTVEMSYVLPKHWTSILGITRSRVFINGNNLFFWSKLPMDIETGEMSSRSNDGYPIGRQLNCGINIDF